MKTLLLYLLLLVGAFAIGIYSDGISGADVVNIGAIFSLKTINGRVSKIAMEAAVEDINSDPSVLGGHLLSLQVHDANYSGFLSMMGAMQFMEKDVVAIVGPQTSVMAHVLSHLANELHVPLLSFTALDPMLSPIQYPYFLQTAPNDMYQMTAIAEIVSFFGWAQVIAIFSDDDLCRNGITALGDKLAERRCEISYKAELPPDIMANRAQIMDELRNIKMMESRVIVVHTTATFGSTLLEMASQLRMVEAGYVWIATSWLSAALDSKPLFHPKLAKTAEGFLTLRPHTPESERKMAFVSRWNQLSNGLIDLNTYGLYAYDTIWVIAHAIKAFFDHGNNISFSSDPALTAIGGGILNLSALSIFNGGQQLLHTILKTNMTGITGPVWFGDGRSLPNPSFDVVNLVGNQARLIGYWSNYSGLSNMPPEDLHTRPQKRSSSNQKLDTVVWPGGTKVKPRGWVFPHNGRKLRIGVPYRASFRHFVSLGNNTQNATGYCIDVFVAAIKLLPYAVPHEFILFGDGNRNPNYNDLVNQITTNEFDAVVGDILIITNRTRIADFTQPYTESGLVVLVPVRKLHSSVWSFLWPFTPYMWAVTALFFLIVGAVIWILEHRINDEFRGPPKKQFITILWFSLSTTFFAHRENTASALGKLVLAIWLFVVLIIQSSYTASLTSILTVQQLSSSIKGIDSLITSADPIGFQVGSFAENYLNYELNIRKSRLVALDSPEHYAEALLQGRVAAVVDERPYIDVFLSEHCQFKVVGQEITKSGWGFAFPRNSPLAVDMSTAILELSESGTLQEIDEYWKRNGGSCGRQISAAESGHLQFVDFIGLFLMCGIACSLSLLAHFFKVLREFRRHSPQVHNPSIHGSSPSARLQTFLSFADKKEDDLKRELKRKRSSTSCNADGREVGSRNGISMAYRARESEVESRHGSLRKVGFDIPEEICNGSG